MSRHRSSVRSDLALRAGLSAQSRFASPDLVEPILDRVDIRRPFLTEIQQQRAARRRALAGFLACTLGLGFTVMAISHRETLLDSLRRSSEPEPRLASIPGSPVPAGAEAAAASLHASAAALAEPVLSLAIGLPPAEGSEAAPLTPTASLAALSRTGTTGPAADLARDAWTLTRAFIAPAPSPRRNPGGGLTDQLESLLAGSDGGLTPR